MYAQNAAQAKSSQISIAVSRLRADLLSLALLTGALAALLILM
jgi:hypothetical protein